MVAHAQQDALPAERGEGLLRCRDAVGAGRQGREVVAPVEAGCLRDGEARGRVLRRDGGGGNGQAGGVGEAPGEFCGGRLSQGGPGEDTGAAV